jgi:hypothetical protein
MIGRGMERREIFLNWVDGNDFIARSASIRQSRHEILEARRVMSWLAVNELGHSLVEVARYLGVTNSCVTRAVLIGAGPQRKNYI